MRANRVPARLEIKRGGGWNMKADAAMKVQCKTLPQFEYEKGEKKKRKKEGKGNIPSYR